MKFKIQPLPSLDFQILAQHDNGEETKLGKPIDNRNDVLAVCAWLNDGGGEDLEGLRVETASIDLEWSDEDESFTRDLRGVVEWFRELGGERRTTIAQIVDLRNSAADMGLMLDYRDPEDWNELSQIIDARRAAKQSKAKERAEFEKPETPITTNERYNNALTNLMAGRQVVISHEHAKLPIFGTTLGEATKSWAESSGFAERLAIATDPREATKAGAEKEAEPTPRYVVADNGLEVIDTTTQKVFASYYWMAAYIGRAEGQAAARKYAAKLNAAEATS
jgi:hypothetical protein